ncbi:MAG: hypothetical protein ACRC35_12795 [Angustibacter sp.]
MARRALATSAMAVAAAIALVPVGATAASADFAGGSQNGNGYGVQVSVTYSGNAAPGGGTRVASVPATCWWEPVADAPDLSSMQAVNDWRRAHHLTGTFTFANVMYGSTQSFQDAVRRTRAGQKLTYYSATCRADAPGCPLASFVSLYPAGPMHSIRGCPNGIPVTFAFFPTGAPPQPRVDPADLAAAARDVMVIPVPELEHNPKVGRLGGATLVSLPTWFWVTDPASVGGQGGTRTIRAEAAGAWAEVVARTDEVTITSPAGGTTCTPAQVLQRWRPGADPNAGCSFSFEKASVGYPGGYPVTASTIWAATWTGSGGTGGSDLPGLSRDATVDVPVAESQALVGPAR